VVVANLEAHQLALPAPEPGAVVRLLCPRAAGAARPPVEWPELYACYSGSLTCAAPMRAVWGAGERGKLHCAGGLAVLLGEWLLAAQSDARPGGAVLAKMLQFGRQVGLVAELDRLVADLDGVRAVAGTDRALAQAADATLRQLQESGNRLRQLQSGDAGRGYAGAHA
jgi:hypothetical protein